MADLRTLAIFVKVAERKSFVRAADDLGITQSGVSNAIKRLEEQTGTRLLARTTRRVSLTDDGAAFFERCRQALAEIEEAEQVLKEAQLTPSGNLRVDLPVSFGRLKMVPLLGPFQARYPDVRLSVSFTDRYIDLIEEGVDICVRVGVLHDSSLIARRLIGSQQRVVGTPAYFAKHGRPKTPDDLANHNCLAFTFRDTRLARLWRFATADGQITLSPRRQHDVQRRRRGMRGDLRRIWARPAARLLSRPRDRPRQARLGARPFLADARADLAGLSADPAPDAKGARVRGFHGRAVSIVGKPHVCAASTAGKTPAVPT